MTKLLLLTETNCFLSSEVKDFKYIVDEQEYWTLKVYLNKNKLQLNNNYAIVI